MNAQRGEQNIDPNGGGGSGGACQICQATSWGNGIIHMSCISPESGNWGVSYCITETIEEERYCIANGDACCVD